MRNKHGSYRLIWLKKSAQLRSFSQEEEVIRPTAGWYSRYGLNPLHFSLLFFFVWLTEVFSHTGISPLVLPSELGPRAAAAAVPTNNQRCSQGEGILKKKFPVTPRKFLWIHFLIQFLLLFFYLRSWGQTWRNAMVAAPSTNLLRFIFSIWDFSPVSFVFVAHVCVCVRDSFVSTTSWKNGEGHRDELCGSLT